MAITRSSISAAMTATQKTLAITSATGLPGVGISARSQIIRVDGESMKTIDGICQVSTGVITLMQRGAEGSTAVAHDILAPTLTTPTASDFSDFGVGVNVPIPPTLPRLSSIGQNGVIAVPVQDTVVLLTKATALASTTLADPPTDLDGVRLTLTSMVDTAHVVTTVNCFDGTSGAHTTLTFAAFIGASVTLMAAAGAWNVISNNQVTIT